MCRLSPTVVDYILCPTCLVLHSNSKYLLVTFTSDKLHFTLSNLVLTFVSAGFAIPLGRDKTALLIISSTSQCRGSLTIYHGRYLCKKIISCTTMHMNLFDVSSFSKKTYRIKLDLWPHHVTPIWKKAMFGRCHAVCNVYSRP